MVSMGGEMDSKAMKQLSGAAVLACKQIPVLIGFGASSHNDFALASRYGQGAVVGSTFVEMLKDSNSLAEDVDSFVKELMC